MRYIGYSVSVADYPVVSNGFHPLNPNYNQGNVLSNVGRLTIMADRIQIVKMANGKYRLYHLDYGWENDGMEYPSKEAAQFVIDRVYKYAFIIE